VFSTWNSILGQNEVVAPISKKNVPKILLLQKSLKDRNESNQLVYNETKNIVYARLKKNMDKLNLQKIEGINKQFIYRDNSSHAEITGSKLNAQEFSTQTDIIVLLESNYKSTISDSSELLITAFNGCNKIRLTEKKIQYENKNNWIRSDLKFAKLDSILQVFLFNSLLENNLLIKKGTELNCLIEFNAHDSSQLILFNSKKQYVQDSIEFLIMHNSIENQYELVNITKNTVEYNSIRMPVYSFKKGACVDENEFFKSIIKLIPTCEINLQILPSGINAVIRVNL
jgi:hypothetical protein